MKRFYFLIFVIILLLCSVSCAALPADSAEEQFLSRDQLHVIFVDVGQGDSILILSPSGQNLLIDSGEADAYPNLKNTLDHYGIKHLDHVIATHPHSDHIGGMYRVFSEYSVTNLYYPKTEIPSRIDEKMLESASENNVSLCEAKAKMKIDLGNGISLEILSPDSFLDDDLNDCSIVALLTYGENTFLFTGDASMEVETHLFRKHPQLRADVLKLGHHGAETSNSPAFLQAISPQIAVCSVGAENTFGHPHESVVNYLQENQITLLRTDLLGNIILSSNGANLSYTSEHLTKDSQFDPAKITVYKEKIGDQYHFTLCEACTDKTLTELTLAEAEALGLSPCKICEE